MIYFQSTWKKYRTKNMYVSTPDGRIEYVAASPLQLEAEMEKFYTDLTLLLKHQTFRLRIPYLGLYESTSFFADAAVCCFERIEKLNSSIKMTLRI